MDRVLILDWRTSESEIWIAKRPRKLCRLEPCKHLLCKMRLSEKWEGRALSGSPSSGASGAMH